MNKAQTFDEVLQELVEAYPEHEVTPGFQVAYLHSGEFYAAIHIFPKGVASRQIVAKAKAKTSGEAIAAALAIWRSINKEITTA